VDDLDSRGATENQFALLSHQPRNSKREDRAEALASAEGRVLHRLPERTGSQSWGFEKSA
jgi:hypothetical protein